MVHYPRFGLVAEEPRGSIAKVWFGTGGSTWFNIQGLGLFQRIHVVHHPRFGLVAEDPRDSLSKVWFGRRGTMRYFIPGLVW